MHFRRCVGGLVGGYVLDVIRKPRTPKLFLECYCIASKSQSGVSLSYRVDRWHKKRMSRLRPTGRLLNSLTLSFFIRSFYFKILLLEVNLPLLLWFTLYVRAIFQVQAPGGLIFGGANQRRVFCVTGLGGLFLEGLIHGGAYFRNFTVFHSL